MWRPVDVRPAVCRHVEHHALPDLPYRLVELLHVGRHVDLLHATVVRDELHPQVLCPQAPLDEVAQPVAVHLHELSREHPAHVEVLRVGLEGLVVPRGLRGARGWHRRDEQRVPQAVPRDPRLQARPVPAPALRGHLPEVKLQAALTRGRASIGLRRLGALRELARGLAGREVGRPCASK